MKPIISKSPYSVGICTLARASICDSVCFRYSTKSAIEIITNWCCSRKASKESPLAIEPSSFIISQINAAGLAPVNRARSTDASVCPVRTKTPSSFAISGKRCPGLLNVADVVDVAISALAVNILSAALIPVVVST